MHGGMGLGIIITSISVHVRIGQAPRAGSPMIIKLSYGSESFCTVVSLGLLIS